MSCLKQLLVQIVKNRNGGNALSNEEIKEEFKRLKLANHDLPTKRRYLIVFDALT